MKNVWKVFLGLVAILAAGQVRAAGFEGEVDMKVNHLNAKDNIVQYYVKGHKGRFNMDSNDGKYSGSAIYDWQTNKIIVLMDKQKMYMVSQAHPEKFHPSNTQHFKITKTGNGLTLLGYKCEEWDYTSDHENGKIWFTSGIGNWWANAMAAQADKLPADQRVLVKAAIENKLFPMKWETTDHSNSYRNSGEVVKVEPKSLDASFFEPPSDYRKFDMGNLLGGGGGNSQSNGNSSQGGDPLSNLKGKLPF